MPCVPSSREVDEDDDDPGRVAGRLPPATGAESVRRCRTRTEPAGRAEGVSDDAVGGRRDGDGDTLRWWFGDCCLLGRALLDSLAAAHAADFGRARGKVRLPGWPCGRLEGLRGGGGPIDI